MRHLLNRKSGKYLCEVKRPKMTPSVTDVGQLLGRTEGWCSVCKVFRK